MVLRNCLNKSRKARNMHFDIPRNELTQIMAVFCDLDGTLLNRDSQLTPRSIQAIRELDLPFVFVTGRYPLAIKEHYERIGLDNYTVVSNGTLIYKGDQLLFSHTLDEDLCHKVLEVIYRYSKTISINIYSKDKWIVNSKDRDGTRLEEGLVGFGPTEECEFFNRFELFSLVNEIFMIGPQMDIEKLMNDLAPFSNELNMIHNHPHDLEIFSKSDSKGAGVKFVQRKIGVDFDHSLAIGDSYLDYSLLESCKFKATVSNAHKEVKEISNIHLRTNDDDGVAMLLETIRILKGAR